MHAVFRKTYYPPHLAIQETEAFKEFQEKHARQAGYMGTIVSQVDKDRYLTVTLWETKEDMDNARKALGPVVAKLLDPIMTAPAKLLGMGPVVVNDLNSL